MQLGALGRVSREFKGKGLQGEQRVYTVREQSAGRGKVDRERKQFTGTFPLLATSITQKIPGK